MQPLEGVGDKAGVRGEQQLFPGAAALDEEAQRLRCIMLRRPGKHSPEDFALLVQVKRLICPDNL